MPPPAPRWSTEPVSWGSSKVDGRITLQSWAARSGLAATSSACGCRRPQAAGTPGPASTPAKVPDLERDRATPDHSSPGGHRERCEHLPAGGRSRRSYVAAHGTSAAAQGLRSDARPCGDHGRRPAASPTPGRRFGRYNLPVHTTWTGARARPSPRRACAVPDPRALRSGSVPAQAMN